MPKDVVALQRQLMAAKTELRNLKLDRTLWRQTLEKARNANPVTITKAQYALLQKAFHPDQEHDTATPERKQQLNAAAAIFNAIKFCLLDRELISSPAGAAEPHFENPNIGYNCTASAGKDGLGRRPCARSVLFGLVSQ